MRISNEVKKEIRAGYQKAARPRQYITEACQRYGLKRETVRKIIGLRTRDPEGVEGQRPEDWPPYEEAGGQERAEQSLAPTVRQPKKSGNPNGRPRRLGPGVEKLVVEDLKRGMLLRECAVRYGCSLDTVHRIRKRHLGEIFPGGNAPKAGRPTLSQAEAAFMLADMQQGMTVAAAAKKYGCCEATVIRIRKKFGFAKSGVPGTPPPARTAEGRAGGAEPRPYGKAKEPMRGTEPYNSKED